MQDKYRFFRKFSLAATLGTYFLIFIGGLVRVSGAGLGCPDWPKCFGSWIPPFSRAQVPAEFNPESFNVTLAWIEYINRLVGVLVGLFIFVMAVLAVRFFRDTKKILWPSVAALVLVAFQGWYGSIVVASRLQSITVSVHLILALVIVSLLIYITQSSFHLGQEAPAGNTNLSKLRFSLLMPLWLISIVQIVLGTQVRTEIETLMHDFPLLLGFEILQRLGMVPVVHSLLGMAFLLLAVFVAFRILRHAAATDFIRMLTSIMVLLVVLQVVIGTALHVFGIPQIMQLFHLWLASLIIGSILILYTELSYN